MIDQNRDGFIDNEDLKDMLASLGQSTHLILPSLSFLIYKYFPPVVSSSLISSVPTPTLFFLPLRPRAQ